MFALILNRTFRWHPVALWRMETWRKLWGNRKSSISSVNVPSLFYSWKKTTNTKDAVFVLVFLFLLPRLHSKQTLLLEMREKVHIPMASSPPQHTSDGNSWLLIWQSLPTGRQSGAPGHESVTFKLISSEDGSMSVCAHLTAFCQGREPVVAPRLAEPGRTPAQWEGCNSLGCVINFLAEQQSLPSCKKQNKEKFICLLLQTT